MVGNNMPTPENYPSEHGQSLVEFAVSVVILFVLMAGIVDLGIAFINFVAMRDAAQEGAIYGAINPDDCEGIADQARESSETMLANVNVDVFVGGTACGPTNKYACSGNTIEVVVSQNYPISIPILGSLLATQPSPAPANTIKLQARIQDTILNPYSSTCTTPTPTPPTP